jgi:hypothetical protein
MIMYSLNPTQHYAPVLVPLHEGLPMVDEMVSEGVPVHTAGFIARDGEPTRLFWSLDSHGHVGTLWEYTRAVTGQPMFNAPETPEVRDLTSMALALEDKAIEERSNEGDREDYAVGE